jgi:hypothetical protein
MTQKPSKISFGQLEIPEPCTVPWDEMDAHAEGQRLCQHCNHVVHDLTGMSTSEIEALYRQQGGKLCGNFSLDEAGQPIYFRGQQRPHKVRLLKHWIAAASLFLLYQSPQAGSAGGNLSAMESPANAEGNPKGNQPAQETITPESNTLLSGLVLTQDSMEIHDDLAVEIFLRGKKLMTLQSVAGLFHHDFAGQLQPTDVLTIHVIGKTFNPGDTYRERKYGSASIETTLGHAQNIAVTVPFKAPPRPKMAGRVIRRPMP